MCNEINVFINVINHGYKTYPGFQIKRALYIEFINLNIIIE